MQLPVEKLVPLATTLVSVTSEYQVEFDPEETKSGITPPTHATHY